MADGSTSGIEENLPVDIQKGIPARLGCGAIIVTMILCSIFILGIVKLIADGEINISRGDLVGYRLWLVRDERLRGLGFSTSQEVDQNGAPGMKCVRTRVRFLEFRSGGEEVNVDYCDCFQSQDGEWMYLYECPG